jgi:hypothetical protein
MLSAMRVQRRFRSYTPEATQSLKGTAQPDACAVGVSVVRSRVDPTRNAPGFTNELLRKRQREAEADRQ